MTAYYIAGNGQKVDLNKTHFLAKGGEGEIYLRGKTIYKICNAGKTIPDGKIKELAVLQNKHIINPKEILLDSKNHPVGYTMDAVPNNPIPLAQILTKTYRQREHVTNDMMMNLIKQIREGLAYVHSKTVCKWMATS